MLSSILDAIQTDPGRRGLARNPADNLFTATAGDFEAACRSIHSHPHPSVAILTGFWIPSAQAFETDGPLGAVFLARAFEAMNIPAGIVGEEIVLRACDAVHRSHQVANPTHVIAIERSGPASDGRCYTMRGVDTTPFLNDYSTVLNGRITIGLGDGGNEIGMGKIRPETIAKNIPNGERIHCRVATDHLIVCGVSNWGGYALAAGLFALKQQTPPPGLFDPDRERAILEAMVRAGPLVDGVTGQFTATVDGLSWEEYVKPLVRMGDILAS